MKHLPSSLSRVAGAVLGVTAARWVVRRLWGVAAQPDGYAEFIRAAQRNGVMP